MLPNESTAFRGVLKTGMPSTVCPPFPGVTPATTFVPYSRKRRVRAWPSRPVMPCTSTAFFRQLGLPLACASDQFVQSGNIQFQMEPLDCGEATFDIAREQFGILSGKFLTR